MANERYSENLVLESMDVTLGENDFGYVFPQGETGNFGEIEKLLKEMGGKPSLCDLDDMSTTGSGKAKPEYIVTFNNDKNTIQLVECKKSLKNHESVNKNMPQKYAVDGALFYAKHLKEEYNVLAVAVSGTSKENVKVNTFYWKKGFETPQELKKAKDTILEPLNYLNLANGKKWKESFLFKRFENSHKLCTKNLDKLRYPKKTNQFLLQEFLSHSKIMILELIGTILVSSITLLIL